MFAVKTRTGLLGLHNVKGCVTNFEDQGWVSYCEDHAGLCH